MAYYRQADARAAFRSRHGVTASTVRAMQQLRLKSQASGPFDIFLSHAILDAEVVAGLVALLEQQGQKVYVDWIVDADLHRDRVDAGTADRLRTRMQESATLIYAASPNARNSKWMPWELGYFDGHKPKKVAIWPLLRDHDTTFVGTEFVGLYPIIERVAGKPTVSAAANSARTRTLDAFKIVGMGR